MSPELTRRPYFYSIPIAYIPNTYCVPGTHKSGDELACENLDSSSDFRVNWPYVAYRTGDYQLVVRDYSVDPPLEKVVADKEDHPTDYFDLSDAKVAWTSMPAPVPAGSTSPIS